MKNKSTRSLELLNATHELEQTDSFIVNERIQGFQIQGATFQHSIFENVGVRNQKFDERDNKDEVDVADCDFSHCVFTRCYFRYVRFRNCTFTNCRFVDCEFPESILSVCKLPYAQFQNTNIDVGNILSNLPPHENLQVGVLRSARMNYSNRGEGDRARKCFLKEMSASTVHHWKIAWDKHSWFRDKYKGATRLFGFLTWLQLKIEYWLWGYGESPLKLVAWALALIMGFSVAYLDPGVSFREALRISAFAFATVGYGKPLTADTHGLDWILVESVIGVLFIGLLAASLFKWISRRQR